MVWSKTSIGLVNGEIIVGGDLVGPVPVGATGDVECCGAASVEVDARVSGWGWWEL